MSITSQPPKHPKAGLYLQCKLFDGITKFIDLEQRIADPDAQRRATNVLWAMLNAPGFALATPDMQQRALDERGRRLHPALYATWHQSDLLADSLHNLRDTLVGWLRGLGGDPNKIYEALGGDAPPEPSIEKARRMVSA